MKKILLGASLLLSCAVHAEEFSTFPQAAQAIAEGKKVTFVVDLKQCTSQMPLSAGLVSITPNAVMVLGTSRITASDRHFSLDDPAARGEPVFGYSKFNIDSSGAASMKITIMNALNYEKLTSYQINCNLGEGFKVFA